ncbi:Arc family DNA-binding protein [Acinetobacter baumannii]|uniref:Arc family DNA-binding protein n=1 Tax=Acinetobacter calcoaceticus/baumannii complex TaxID=909768 RepID=UPI0007081079|nr:MULTISPECIES: Arc family DNA-binding protein [Acinetobacter calcoaceticus/baumannii complex]EHZ6744149.1 Arc family DNA-binding protein [Acinetobacter baumannii]EHZ6755515.1 Arc family DNA-binding protein [Acinetobacter baumannii]EHZ7537015.1 Arc family DNA-binding protein [Acinetobacter baumannii]EHZ7932099.1 Arc family DNA-binding protein [Acinetobacter baumannii]EHZ7980014.1 Arc family DNA-binding protein [Acinetobacter baumannii]
MARTDPQINIRVPAELKKKLETLALENNRSLNAEVVTRLESSFDNECLDLYKIPLEKLMSVVMERFGENSISLTFEETQRIKKAP